MARLPSEEQIGALPSALSGRQVATIDTSAIGRGMSNFGEGLSSAGASINNVAERERAADSQLGLARADAAFKVDEIRRRNSLRDDDPDYEAWGESYRKGSRESLAKAEALLPNDPNLRERWRLRNQDEIAKGEAYVDQRMQVRRNDNLVATATSELETARRGALEAPDEPSRIKLIDAGKGIIEGLRGKGILSDTQAQKLTKSWNEDYARGSLQLLSPEERIDALRGSVKNTAGFVDRIIGAESGGDAGAKNPNSSASGLGQFIDSTWISFMRARHPDILEAEGPRGALRLKNDPKLGREATGWYAEENARELKAAGLPADYGSVYLAHFLGPAGAKSVLKADKDLPAEAIIGSDAVNANPFLRGKSVGQVIAWANRKMGGAGSGADVASILAPDQRAQMLEQARNQELQIARQEAGEAVRQSALRAETYERGIIDASAGVAALPPRSTIADAQDISLAQKNTLLRQYDAAARKLGEDDAAAARVINKIETGQVLNPRDSEDKDGLAALDKRTGVNTGLQKSDAPSQAVAIRQFATTGMVTDTQRGTFEGMIRSGTPQQLEFAMTTLDSMYRANPNSFVDAFGKDTFGNLQAWQSRVDRNPTEFRAWLKDASDPAKQKAREGLEKDARKIVDKQDSGDILHRFDAHTWIPGVGDPNAPVTTDRYPGMAVLKQEYSEAFVEGYAKNGGDEPQAHEYATRVMKQSWADSKLGGNKMMKFAPELVLPTYDGSHAWAQKQIDDAVGKLTGSGRGDATTVVGRIQNSPLGRAEADLFGRRPEYALVPTPETKAEIDALRSGRGLPNGRLSPAWRLMYRDAGTGEIKDGGWFYFDAKGERDARAKDLNKQRSDAIAADEKAGASARERLAPYNERQDQMRQLSERADPSRANKPTWSTERKLTWEADMADKARRDSEGSP